MNKILNEDISFLELNDNIKKVLINNNILVINDLWKLSKNELRNIGLGYNEINQIIIKLQLHGIDLNKKVYSNIKCK